MSARTKTLGPEASKAEVMRALEVNRGLRAETIEKFAIGYSPKRRSYAYPCDNGAVRLKRFDDRKPRYSWEQAGRTSAVYGLRSALTFKGDRVFLCEGEPDVWTMQQAGLAAVTFTSGCNSVPEDGIQTLAESRFTEVSIIYDHDDPGRKGRWKAAAAIKATGMSVRVFDLPDSLPPGSDVSSYYNVLDRNDEAFREAISNLEQLADSSSKPEQDPPLTHNDRSDSDNATRFVDLHGDCLHFVPKWKKWIIFLKDRQTWLEDDADVQVRELAKAVGEKLKRDAVTVKAFSHAIRSLSKNGITAMVDLARGVEGIPLDHEDLDSDGSTLGVENGVVDLKTGKLRGADPADLMTKQCPVRFDEDAHCPRFEQAMEEWFPDEEVRRYVQRVAGSALVGFQKDHVFIIHYGGGRNGKGTFTRALQHALGPYARVIHLSLLVHSKGSQHDTIKADLFRARLAVASELKIRIPLDEASVKNLTGGDRITARRMHQDPWEFDPSHSLWLQTNYLPQITGRDRGIWSRIKVVRWEATFEGKKDDQNLDEKLREEAPGILNWLIAGCLEWQEHGLKEPKAVVRETLAYRQAEDVLNVFLSEAGLAFDSSLEIKARELQELLADWSKEEGRPAPTRDVKGWLLENGVTQIQRREDGKRPRYWLGIGVKDPKGDTDETA